MRVASSPPFSRALQLAVPVEAFMSRGDPHAAQERFINVRRGLGVACLSPGRVSAGVDRCLRAYAASTGHALIAASAMYVPRTGCVTPAAYNNYCRVGKFMPAGGVNRFLPRLIPVGIN